jgi:hypothetical protein
MQRRRQPRAGDGPRTTGAGGRHHRRPHGPLGARPSPAPPHARACGGGHAPPPSAGVAAAGARRRLRHAGVKVATPALPPPRAHAAPGPRAPSSCAPAAAAAAIPAAIPWLAVMSFTCAARGRGSGRLPGGAVRGAPRDARRLPARASRRALRQRARAVRLRARRSLQRAAVAEVAAHGDGGRGRTLAQQAGDPTSAEAAGVKGRPSCGRPCLRAVWRGAPAPALPAASRHFCRSFAAARAAPDCPRAHPATAASPLHPPPPPPRRDKMPTTFNTHVKTMGQGAFWHVWCVHSGCVGPRRDAWREAPCAGNALTLPSPPPSPQPQVRQQPRHDPQVPHDAVPPLLPRERELNRLPQVPVSAAGAARPPHRQAWGRATATPFRTAAAVLTSHSV